MIAKTFILFVFLSLLGGAAAGSQNVTASDLGAVDAAEFDELELGKWYLNWSVCKQYAEENGIPLLAVWSNKDCPHCFALDSVFTNEAFTAWQKENDAGKVICCFMSGGEGTLDQKGSSAYNWMRQEDGANLTQYPFVAFYWPTNSIDLHESGDAVRQSSETGDEANLETDTQHVIDALETAFLGWQASPYTGGEFKSSDTEWDRYEAEPGFTSNMTITLIRSNPVSYTQSATNYWQVVFPDGNATSIEKITWQPWYDVMDVRVAFEASHTVGWEGSNAVIRLMDDAGKLHSLSHIAFVRKANSAANPYWLTERNATNLDWGEWTCSLDVATNKTAAADGEAWTLVCTAGSLWCPDCYKNDKFFLDQPEFRKWALDNHIALCSVDTPHNSAADPQKTAGCIWSRTADMTALVRVGEITDPSWENPTEEDFALTNKVKRSGTGYLSRKMISDGEADRMSNWMLDLSQGFFHLPEDYCSHRTMIPMLALLDKTGRLVGRFETFDYVSPCTTNDVDAYILRLQEMIKTAKSSSDSSFEIANDNCATTQARLPVFGMDGDEASTVRGSISHADYHDIWRLDGATTNACVRLCLEGAADTDVRLSILSMRDGEDPVLIDTVIGNLKKGLSWEGVCDDEEFSYYARVSCKDPYAKIPYKDSWGEAASPYFLSTSRQTTIADYELSAKTVLVPQESVQIARFASGATVVMSVITGEVYKIGGIRADVPIALLEKCVEMGDGFYRAVADGEAPLTTDTGSVTYQVWHPGSVSFSTGVRRVFGHSGSGVLDVVRAEGVSGQTRVRISLQEADPAAEGLYVWDGDKVLEWADGEAGVKSVSFEVIESEKGSADGHLQFGLATESGSVSEIVAPAVMTVILSNTDAPCLEDSEYEVTAIGGFDGTAALPVVNVHGGDITCKIVSGQLPSGVKISYDASTGMLLIGGVPKGIGTYTFQLQLVEDYGSTHTVGLPCKVSIDVGDPEEYNSFVGRVRSSQTIPLFDEDRRLSGELSVAITSRNRISARYRGMESKTISFSGTWQFMDRSSGFVSSTFSKDRSDLVLSMDPNGRISAEMNLLDATVLDGAGNWPSLEDFSSYRGYYNVAVTSLGSSVADACPSNTSACLSLTMQSRSAIQKGIVRYAGYLPDGSSICGSSTLISDPDGDGSAKTARLYVFRRTLRDVLGVGLSIAEGGSYSWCDTSDPAKRELVSELSDCRSYLLRRDTVEESVAQLCASGVWYSQNVSPSWLSDMCYREIIAPSVSYDLYLGDDKIGIVVTTDRGLRLLSGSATGLSLSFSRQKGSLCGRIRAKVGGDVVQGRYRGILIPGWVRTCDCGYIPPERPFGMGFFTYSLRDDRGDRLIRSLPITLEPKVANP